MSLELDALLALSADPFEKAGARDHYGRPIVKTLDGKDAPYRRPSTQAKALDDMSGLVKWKAGMAARGVAENHRTLGAQIAQLDLEDDRKELYALAEQAADLAGASDGANLGTLVHTICELIDKGEMEWPLT